METKLISMSIEGKEQGLKVTKKGEIMDAYCLCEWGTFNRTAWEKGEKLYKVLF